MKAAYHHGGQVGHPDSLSRTVSDRDVAQLRSALRRWIPDLDSPPLYAETCMYTTTADETFILERRGRIVVGSPCSGHGFKFAPAIGERLAALASEALES